VNEGTCPKFACKSQGRAIRLRDVAESIAKREAEYLKPSAQTEDFKDDVLMISKLWDLRRDTEPSYSPKLAETMEPTSGLEPLTCRLRIGCSTN
jgi:hypothetical protein